MSFTLLYSVLDLENLPLYGYVPAVAVCRVVVGHVGPHRCPETVSDIAAATSVNTWTTGAGEFLPFQRAFSVSPDKVLGYGATSRTNHYLGL
jgi:hypothetical protein